MKFDFADSRLMNRIWPAATAFAATLLAAGVYLKVTPPQYESTARLMINPRQLTVSNLGQEIGSLNAIPGASLSVTQVELIRSQKVLERALARTSSTNSLAIDTVRTNLRVSIVPGTGILELNFKGKDPETVESVLRAVIDEVIDENTMQNRAEARNARLFLEKEVASKLSAQVKAAHDESQYKASQSIISLTAQTKAWVESLSALQDQEREVSSKLLESESRNKDLQSLTGGGSPRNQYISLKVSQSVELKQLRSKLEDLEGQLITLHSKLGDKHPDLLSLTEQRDSIKKLYLKKLSVIDPGGFTGKKSGLEGDQFTQDLVGKFLIGEIERSAMKRKQELIRVERQNLETQLAQLPVKEQALADLSRKKEDVEASLRFMQPKLEEARLAESQLTSNLSVIDPASRPTHSKWPDRSVVFVIASVAGICLGLGVALVIEALDRTLRGTEEAKAILKLPVLAVLPQLSESEVSLTEPDKFLDSETTVEAYRMLLRSMEFRRQKPLSMIVVSSAVQGEGKSLVASHLATLCSMLSIRTLLIDADLRRPVQHRLFEVESGPGLSDLLLGKVSANDAIRETDIRNLYLLASGSTNSRPSQLLDSERMSDLLGRLRSKFDLIIIDTPPLTSSIDASVLSQHSDGMLLVTRPNFTPRQALEWAASELSSNQVEVIGFVANAVDIVPTKYYRTPRVPEVKLQRLNK
jgi:polysaccharide biosynthesis transport protein